MRLVSYLAGLLLTTAWFGCSSSDNSGGGGDAGIHTGPLSTIPNMNGDPKWPISVWGTLWQGDAARDVVLDTGSLYFLVGPTGNPPGQLPCSDPQEFYYLSGGANYCPTDGTLEMIDSSGANVALSPDTIRCGDSYFLAWGATTPYAMLGLSGNLSGTNQKGMKSVTEQLLPKHMSFEWPDGRQNPGSFRFDALDRPAGSGTTIPLVDPTSLGFGYTSRFERVDFILDDKVHTSVVNRHAETNASKKGVYLIIEGEEKGKVADDFVSIFDTGSRYPLDWGNGDYSWLEDPQSGYIVPEHDAAFYDSFNVVFMDENGVEVTLKSGPQKDYISWSWQVNLITKPALPAGMKLLYIDLGINFIGMWDLQFDFDSEGRAETITFFERGEGS